MFENVPEMVNVTVTPDAPAQYVVVTAGTVTPIAWEYTEKGDKKIKKQKQISCSLLYD